MVVSVHSMFERDVGLMDWRRCFRCGHFLERVTIVRLVEGVNEEEYSL